MSAPGPSHGDGLALRLARRDELPRLLEIEDDAGRLYERAGLPGDLPGLPISLLERGCAERQLWVLAEADDRPIAFALGQRYPEALHLRELDVATSHMRRGLGRRLIEHVRAHAQRAGLRHVTLTTFAEVPWNAPLYRRYGFHDVERDDQPAWLRAIRDEEDAGVLARWPRIAMARSV